MRRILAMTLISMTMTGPVWACGMPSDMNLEDLMVEIDEPMDLAFPELADVVVVDRPEGQPASQALFIPQS